MVSGVRSGGAMRAVIVLIWVVAAVDVALLVMRFRLVASVTGSFIGQSCANLRPYDSSEKTNLIVITVLSLALCVAILGSLKLLGISKSQRLTMIALCFVILVVLAYVTFVWMGGLELSNKVRSEVDPCGGIRRP